MSNFQRTSRSWTWPALTCGLVAGGCLLACGGGASDSASGSGSQLSGLTGTNSGTSTAGAASGVAGPSGTSGAASGPPGSTATGTSNEDITGLNVGNPALAMMEDTSCIQQGVEIETLTPTIELLVDRSQSMEAAFGTTDRWNTIRNVLVDPTPGPTQGFVQRLEAKVRFGLALYTGLPADPDTGMAASCPDLIKAPTIALNNATAIHDIFMAHEVGNNTPTGESLVAITTDLEAVTEVGPKVIVLATDGDPDSCADPNSNGTEPPRAASLAAIQAAWAKNIATYVISVGNEATAQHLQALAVAGQGGAAGAKYYEALDTAALIDAFSSILRGVVSCDFNLNGTVTPQNAPRGTVSIDGTPLVYGDPNGWELVGESTVRLLGMACDNVKLSVSFVDIKFPCGVLVLN